MTPVFESPKPTQTITFHNNFVKVVTKLYGPISVDRMNSEQAILRHRVDQLSPPPVRKERQVEEDYSAFMPLAE